MIVTVAVALSIAAFALPTDAPAEPSSQVRVIVELDSPAALTAVDARSPGRRAEAWERAGQRAAALREEQHGLLRRADHAGIDVQLVHQLTAAYNGIVAEIPAADVDELAALPGVRAVHEDTYYEHALADSVPLVGAPEVWEQTDPDGTPVTGAGVTVAVIDTGIDYTHPDLGGGFGPGHKVVAGHDFVNDDADPMDDHGHGTHVAGIVAADGAVRGVAPDVTLTAYKVLNQFGDGLLSDIIAGIDAAVDPDNPHRADVVNLSLSGPGDGTDPLSVAADQAVAAGVVVVAAAGNDGPLPQSVRSPAAAESVLAVGASASGLAVPRAHLVEPVREDLRAVREAFSANPPETPLVAEVVDVGLGDPGSYDDVDVTGAAVLVSTFGGDNRLAKAMYAEQRGAAAALFYSPEPPSGGGGIGPGPVSAAPKRQQDAFSTGIEDNGRLDSLVAMLIPGPSGSLLLSHLDHPARVEITGVDATDWLVDFSARGPSRLFAAKPDLVAPGVEIWSTLPGGTHGRASGTSMAAPHVAGAAALLRQLHSDWQPQQVASALTGSARRLDASGPPDTSFDVGPLDQGAGRLDVAAAADTTIVAEPRTLSFGLADLSGEMIDRTGTVTLRNTGTDPATLDLAVELFDDSDATVTVEPDTVDLGPGGSVDVDVRVELATPRASVDVTGWVVVDNGQGVHDIPLLLAVRHVGVHVTPDPAPADTQTAIFVQSPAELASPPSVEVTCPGLAVQRPVATPISAQRWRAEVEVADAGACQVTTSGVAADRYGSPALAGEVGFEVVAAPDRGRGADRWQSVGPDTAAGRMAFNVTANRNQVAVVPIDQPSAFISYDRMRTWREFRTMPMAGGTPRSVDVTPAGDLYVAVGGAGDGSFAGRIMHSTDGGESWRILPGPDEPVIHVAVDDAGTALAVVTADEKLRLSLDGGATWATQPSPWANVLDLHWIGSDLYLGTIGAGLVVVRDAATPAPEDPVTLARLGLLGHVTNVAGDEKTLVATPFLLPDVYVSHDQGKTFEEVLQVGTGGLAFHDLELIGDDIYALRGAGGLWIGRDRGAEWEPWGEPLDSAREVDVGVAPWSDTPYVATLRSGIFAADSPGEFRRVGVPGAWIFDLATTGGAGDQALVAGTIADAVWAPLPDRAATRPGDPRRPGDLAWSQGREGQLGTSAPFVEAAPSDPSVVYKLVDSATHMVISRSDDGGRTWQTVAEPAGEPTALLVHPADPDRIYAGYRSGDVGLVVSNDGGATWRKISHGIDFGTLAGDPTNPERIWAGETPDSSFGRNGLWVSEDGGLSFRQLSDVQVTAIAVDPEVPDRLLVGGRGLYTSDNGGQTLMPAEHVDLDMWINDLLFSPDGDRVFAAAGSFFDDIAALKGGRGVLVSDDRGDSWESFSTGLTNFHVTSLAVDRDGRHLYAGIGGGSVHRLKLTPSR